MPTFFDPFLRSFAETDLAKYLVLEGGWAIHNVWGCGAWSSPDLDFTLFPEVTRSWVIKRFQEVVDEYGREMGVVVNWQLSNWSSRSCQIQIEGPRPLTVDITRTVRKDDICLWAVDDASVRFPSTILVHSREDLAAGKVACIARANRVAARDLYHLWVLSGSITPVKLEHIERIGNRLAGHRLGFSSITAGIDAKHEVYESLWPEFVAGLPGPVDFITVFEQVRSLLTDMAERAANL